MRSATMRRHSDWSSDQIISGLDVGLRRIELLAVGHSGEQIVVVPERAPVRLCQLEPVEIELCENVARLRSRQNRHISKFLLASGACDCDGDLLRVHLTSYPRQTV